MIQKAFAQMISHLDPHLPEEHMRDRRNGSLPYGSGRLFYTFGEEDGREYLEYDTHHRMGDDHGTIYEDGEFVGLPELCSMFGYNPKIPGDEERKRAMTEREDRETLEDLIAKGILDDEPVPNALAVNSYLVLHGDDAEGGDPSG